MPKPLTYTTVKNHEVDLILDKFEQILVGEKLDHVVTACLAVAVASGKPGITAPQLAEGVRGASEWIYAYLDSISAPTTSVN